MRERKEEKERERGGEKREIFDIYHCDTFKIAANKEMNDINYFQMV